MTDFDDDDLLTPNPFQPRRHERILGPSLQFLAVVWHRITWPFVRLTHLLAQLISRSLWRLGWMGFQLRRGVARCWDVFVGRLRLERVGRLFHNLKSETSRTLGRWIIWPFIRLGQLLAELGGRLLWGMEWIGFQLQRGIARCWAGTVGRLRLDSVVRQLHGLQTETSKALGGFSDSIRSQTTGARWFHRVLGFFGAVIRRIQGAAAACVDQVAWWSNQSVVTRTLLLPVRWSAQSILLITDFLLSWVWTRSYGQLWMGIPALVLLLPLVYCAVRLPFYSDRAKAAHYRQAASEALQQEKYEEARLCYRKLQQLDGQNERTIYETAMMAAQQDDFEEAYRRLQPLVNEPSANLPDAHLWIARAISFGFVEQDNPQRSQLVEEHVNHVLSLYPDQPDANLLLAELRVRTGQRDESLKLLKRLRKSQLSPSQQVELARLYALADQKGDSIEIAREVLRTGKQDALADRGKREPRTLPAASRSGRIGR